MKPAIYFTADFIFDTLIPYVQSRYTGTKIKYPLAPHIHNDIHCLILSYSFICLLWNQNNKL